MNTDEEKILAHFERKRTNFLEDYKLQDRPVLTIQCQASSIGTINVEQQEVLRALEAGAINMAQDGWWRGFVSQDGVVRVFDGVSSTRPSEYAKYSTEVHEDGHFIAAVWGFPEKSDTMLLGEFYGHAFRDALFTAQQVLVAAGVQGKIRRTAVLDNSNKIGFLRGGYELLPAPGAQTAAMAS
ncbi:MULTISPECIES: hypothetical protein [unclassified Delftia]|uniref:hypothetical protein n=1 Tax=unclassified Delftia TaxID=2613839 RepID=UPI0019003ED0|nr:MULTISPECIES: hypothetical protein [unclassified Delftia]MBK0114062.1 hypothetical protein [Delftia sp. S65]MBK0117870.1 hypothetical protein [Delftia sp. S67]MBK0129131.1 hypothetical protein [Delftia sp. S66]